MLDDQNMIIDYDLKNIKMKKQPENPKNRENATGLPDNSEYDDEDEEVEKILYKKSQKKEQKKAQVAEETQEKTNSVPDLLEVSSPMPNPPLGIEVHRVQLQIQHQAPAQHREAPNAQHCRGRLQARDGPRGPRDPEMPRPQL